MFLRMTQEIVLWLTHMHTHAHIRTYTCAHVKIKNNWLPESRRAFPPSAELVLQGQAQNKSECQSQKECGLPAWKVFQGPSIFP